MQTLAPGRLALTASLLLALAGCAHHTTQYPPSDAFFNNPPPEGELTPAKTGPGDRPPERKATTQASTTAPAAPAAATGKAATQGAAATSGAPSAAASSVAGAAAGGAAAGAAAGGAATGTAVGAAVAGTAAAATAVAVAKPSAGASDTTQAKVVHVDELPVAISRVPPQYPDAARAAGTQGTVQLEALVKTDGTVGDVRVDVSVPGLDEAAKACLRQWTFKPGMSAGKPVEAWVGVPISFHLR